MTFALHKTVSTATGMEPDVCAMPDMREHYVTGERC